MGYFYFVLFLQFIICIIFYWKFIDESISTKSIISIPLIVFLLFVIYQKIILYHEC